MSVLKEFRVREQIRLAFRAELYGALNHIFVQSNTNFSALYNTNALDYVRYVNPPVAPTALEPRFSSLAQNIGGNRTIQLGLKLFF